MSNALAAEVSARSSAVVSHSSGLSSAVSTLTAADISLSNALAAEVTTRSSAVVSHSSAWSSAVSTLTAADTSLTNALATEVTTRSGSVVSVSTTLYNAVSSIVLVISAQATALATEVTTRSSAVVSISTAFANASASFHAIDSTLATSIVSLVSQVALKANKTYLDSVISQVVGNAPTNLDTLYEIAAALNNNNNFAGSITTVLATKADATSVSALATTLATKANQSDLTSLSTLVDTKAATATVSTMQINVNNLTNSKDTLVTQVNNLITTGGNVNSSNVGVNGVTLTDLATRAQELYYKFGYVNGDGTINYKINVLATPTLVTSWLEFVLDANYDVTSVNHKATVKFDKYQTNVQYGALNVVSTINNISLNSNFQHTFTATYVGGPNEYNQNATNMYITSLESPIRMAPTSPMLTIVPPELGTTTNVSQSGQSVSLFIWNPLYKQYLLTRSEYAATTWSDATGLITQPVTIQTDSGSVLKFDTGTYTGVTIELFNNATLVSDKTFSTTAASSTYLVKYAPSVVNPPGIISVSYSTNYISFTLEQSVYDDILSDTKFIYISAASMAIDTPYQAAFTDLPMVYWMSPSYATASATVLQSRTQSFVVTPTTTILGKRLRFNNHARSFGNLQNQYYWDNHKQFVDIRTNGTVENHVGAISVRVLNSASKIGSDPLTIVNVFNDYAQYAAPTMVANSKTVSKSGAAYTYTATFTNADGAAMQVLNADNSVASAQPTVNVAYSYPTTYDSSKIGQPIFKINVPTSGSKRASTYLVINGEDIAAHATPVLSGSVAYAGTAGAYTATATYTFNANVSAVKVMKSDGSTIIASQSVSAGTATLVIPYNDASIGMTYNVVALANDTGTQSASSSQVALMYPSSPVSTDTNVALKMLSKIQGPPLSSIGYSRSVAVNQTTGNIYVAALNNHNILVLNRAGNFMFKIGGAGSSSSANGEFNSPEGIAVDTYGNIYVADTTNHRVQIFDNTGRFMLKFGSNGTDNGQFTRPTGIAILSDGKICVSDTGNNRVQVFDSIGTFVFKIGGATTAASSADGEFNTPLGITVDSENNIIVADVSNNRIQVFNSTGTFMCKFGSYGTGNLNLIGPQGVAVDTTGKILVSDTDNSRIQVLSRTGNTISYVRTIGSFGESDAQFKKQRGIAVDADNNIIIANTNENNIKIFKNDGTFSFKITGPLFNGINGGVALDTTGNIWVADTTNNVIKKFTSAGIYVSQVGSGSSGTGNGQFSTPYGIGINMQTGYLYISDINNNRVQIFTSAGTYVNQFGSYGTSNGQFSLPRGVAVDAAGNIYVADTNNNRIQKFTSVGAHTLTIGTVTAGSANGLFNSPFGVAVDAAGNIYVADRGNNRIQKFDSTGAHTLTIGTVTAGSDNGLFNRPSAISVDMNGNIIVLDSDNNRFQIFNSAGNYVRQFGSNGTGNGQFAYPTGMALNAAGNIVVVDSDNLRIQIIGPTPDLELDANNGVTIKFIGNSSTVLSTAPKFVYANPRGTGSEWFAVVDNSTNAKNMIVNYAANLLSGTGRTYFTNGANGVVAFNNIVTTLMTNMYALCSTTFFNEPIASWDTSNVITMNTMFRECDTFNQPISNWNTANVNNMAGMFGSTKEFNQYIGSWNTINVTIMTTMFSDSRKFNKPIGLWNTSNVTMMTQMFEWTRVFNQPIGSWNTVNVIYMDGMFKGASVFNQNISTWNVANVSPNPPPFFNTSSGSISVANLPKWAPVLSNFTVGTKALLDGAFAITAPTSTVATTYATNALKPTILFNGITNTDTGYASTANGAISGDGTIIAVMSSIAPSGATLQMYKYNSTPSTYAMNTMTLNGTTNGIQLSDTAHSNVIGLVSGKKGTISMWWNLTAASSGSQMLWVSRNNSSNGDIVSLIRLPDGSIYFKAGNVTTNVILATTSNAVCASAGMYHIFVSWDTGVLNRVNILINGVQQTLTMGGFILNSTIEYGANNHGIGGNLYSPFSPTTPGMVGQVYVNYVEYVDPSNIGKFYGGANTPVGLGENGNVPTGSIPTFYIEYSPVCGLVNLGSSLIRFLPYGSLVAGTIYNGTGAGFGNYWSQLGGSIVGTGLLGMVKNSTDPSCISMSANGKLICVGQEYNQMTILKFDDTKTIAPAKWIVSQLNLTTSGLKVVLSGDGNTFVVGNQVFSTTDGGTTWTQKGQNLNGTLVSTSISANGLTIVAALSNASYVITVYTWYLSSWVSSTPIGSGGLVAISGDGNIINKTSGRFVVRYSLNAGAWTYVGTSVSYSELEGSRHMSTSFDGSFTTCTCQTNSGELRLFRWNGSSNVNLIDQKVISNRTNGNSSNYYPFASTLSYAGRFIVGGLSTIGVYDIISNGAITYTSSNPSVADLYGNGVLMKAVGTSTITASQTTATGTGTITSTLTVIPPFATPVLSNKVFALTATPGAYTFTATVTVEAAVTQIKIVKLGAADTIHSVTGGSVSISMSYATVDLYTSFYVVAVANSTAEKGQSNPVSQTFLDPPPVLSNFTVGTKALADVAFVLTEPTSTTQIAYTANSITRVGQAFTGLTTTHFLNLVRISADGTAIGIVLGTSAGTVRMYKLIDNVWTQWGGDITGTANGMYAGAGMYYSQAVQRWMGDDAFSMSADGTLLITVQTGLGGVAGFLNIYKYDVNKTTAQTTNATLSTYGPINWSRVATMQMISYAPNVALSADGKTIAVSDYTLRMYRSDDGGTTWTQKGGTITDTDPLYTAGFHASISISANGLAVLAAPTKNQYNLAKFTCYEWDGLTWNASFICEFNWSSMTVSGAISADGKVCVVAANNNVIRYTKNVSGVWTLAHSLNVYQDVFNISTSADGTFISFGRAGNSPTHGDAEIHRWNGSAYVPVINNRTIQNRTTDSMQFNTMISSDGTRVAVGGKGKVDVYDLNTTSKTAYTSSAPAIASVYGNLVLMKAAGTSTITAIQTNAAGSSAPITSTLTVNPLRAIGTVSIDTLAVKSTFSGTTFNTPGNNAIDLNGNIYVADALNHVIKKFTSAGVYVSQIGSQGTEDGKFNTPRVIAISYRTGNIYVTDTANNRIQMFNGITGAFMMKFGSQGTEDGKFNTPWGIAIDNSDYVYVSDSGNNRIQIFNGITGTYVSQFGLQGTVDGKFASPKGIQVLSNGNIIVLDTDNNRLQTFTGDGVYVSKFGSQGTGDGQFSSPIAFAIDAVGNIVVADTYNNRIQIFTSTGTHVSTFGSLGTANGKFNAPMGVSIDSTGNIVVSDVNNNRVQILQGLPPLELDAMNGVTVKFVGNSSTVSSSAPRFITQNVRGTSELFAVVDDSANARAMITNYATNLSAGSGRNYFTKDGNAVPFNNIVTTLMTYMRTLFMGAQTFNEPIASWDTSNVTTMYQMFWDARAFNQPIGNWNTTKVTAMDYMTYNAYAFNQNISGWNTLALNRSISPPDFHAPSTVAYRPVWGTTPVLILYANNVTVRYASANSLSSVPKFVYENPRGTGFEWFAIVDNSAKAMIRDYATNLLSGAGVTYFTYNGNLVPFKNIVTTLMTNMRQMLENLPSFNQPIASWDTSNVTDMFCLFANDYQFNQDISKWNTSNVTDMGYMLYETRAFNQYIRGWNTLKIPVVPASFANGSAILSTNMPIWGTAASGWATPNGV